ncbi:MAG: glucoamylase family protein [Bacteroidota bacterium]
MAFVKKYTHLFSITFLAALFIISCSTSQSPQSEADDRSDTSEVEQISEDSLMTLTQERTFQYFWDGAEPNSGMAPERYHVDGDYPQNDEHVVTTGGSGFGIMAIIVGMERNFISQQEGIDRLQRITDFLEESDRFKGAWSHWINGETGETKPFGEKDDGADLVETSFLVQGLITARQYLRQQGGAQEEELANQIDELWREVEWDWFTKDGEEDVLYWHWSPDHGWEMDFPLEGYNEVLITYVMAASSPTHGISDDPYHEGWARGGGIEANVNTYGYELQLSHNGAEEYGGPLFWAHYSYLGLDPRGLEDQYADYWEENRNHTLINRQWVIENPEGYEGYGEDLWGLTASYSVDGYAAHRPTEDLGVITPTAALSSFPYTPEESMDVLENLYYNYNEELLGKYGFYDAFSVEHSWYPQRYLAIDQGPIVVMMENHRSGLLWDLFMSAPEVQEGLEKLDFESPHLN